MAKKAKKPATKMAKNAVKKAAKNKATAHKILLHPAIDKNFAKSSPKAFIGGILTCKCACDPVTMAIHAQSAHNHACGCTKCWKPAGAIFSVVAVVPRDKVQVTANGHKLQVVDASATIQRHACTTCGTHMFGRVEKQDHGFHGLDFIHTELASNKGW